MIQFYLENVVVEDVAGGASLFDASDWSRGAERLDERVGRVLQMLPARAVRATHMLQNQKVRIFAEQKR